MTMVMPLCPICHKMYSDVISPVIVQPCGHGACSACIHTYIENHEGKTCPTCRTDITKISPNYDLREMCVVDVSPLWAEKLLRIIPPGTCVGFNENLEDMSQLIVLRLRNKYIERGDTASIKDLKNALAQLILNKEFEYILKWIVALNFDDEIEIILVDYLSKINESYSFLKSENADWLMSLIDL